MSSRALLRAAHGLLLIALWGATVLVCGDAVRGDEPLYLPPAPDALPFHSAAGQPLLGPIETDYVGFSLPLTDALPMQQPEVRYWIVSSRGSPQDIASIHCGRLCVYERRCDGTVCPSSLANLQARLHPGAPVLISMHGTYVSWDDNLVQSDGTYEWVHCACPNLPLNVIFFTWPSDRERCLLAPCELNQHGCEAETNAFYVASLLACLPDCHPVCLLGHSFGARMAAATLHLAGGGSLQGVRFAGSVGAKRIRAIFAAGAFDHNWLNSGSRYGCALYRAECVLNMQNRHDVTLKAYPLLRPLFARRAIGASGVTFLDRHHQDCTDRLRELDVTSVIGHGHLWPNYYLEPRLSRMIAGWIFFPEVNFAYQPAAPILPPHELQAVPATTAIEASSQSNTHPAGTRQVVATAAISAQPAAQRRATLPATSSRSASAPTQRATPVTSARSTSTSQPRLLQWFRSRGE
jgi:hypothetical protein